NWCIPAPGHITNPALFLCFPQLFGVNRTLKYLPTIPFPYIQIRVVVSSFLRLHLIVQDLWEERIVPPGSLNDQHLSWISLLHEPYIGIICLQLWIEGYPNLGVFLPNSRDQYTPRVPRNLVRFLYPTNINTFIRLDLSDIVLDPFKTKRSPIPR